MAKIDVVGAGISGIWHALILQKRGHEVTLWDPDGAPSPRCVSRLSGAMLAPYCEGEAGHESAREYGIHSLGLWRQHYPGTVMHGTLVVALPRDQAEISRFAAVTKGHRLVETDELRALEPALSDRFGRGLYFEAEGHVETWAALEGLVESAKAHGARVVKQAFTPAEEASTGADFIVDCRGIAAKDYFKTLRGVRGERFVLHCPDLVLSRPIRLLHPRVAFYIVPWSAGRFLIGATLIESEDESPASLRSALELFNAAYALLPQLAEARVVDWATGVRPAFPDNMPKVIVKGRHLRVNGFYRHGFLLSPLIAEISADYIDGGKTQSGVVFEDLGQW